MTVAIVGSGMSGLISASALTQRGHNVFVFDKSRGPGGRMATRRVDGLMFDHGAQYFTARDPLFREYVEKWISDGVVRRWEGRVGRLDGDGLNETEGPTDRYVGFPRMSALTRHLSQDLNISFSTPVERVTHDGAGWHLQITGQSNGPFDALFITTPPEQVVPMLSDAHRFVQEAQKAEMDPCWAVMAAFKSILPIELDGVFVNDGPISWAARNSSKPGRPSAECWVLHGSPEWSREHLELPAEEVSKKLLSSFFSAFGIRRVDPTFITAHRWRYAKAVTDRSERVLWDPDLGLALGGDWVSGANVEGAFLSGIAAAGCVSL